MRAAVSISGRRSGGGGSTAGAAPGRRTSSRPRPCSRRSSLGSWSMSASGPPPADSSWAHGRTGGRVLASGESLKGPGGLVGRDQELGRVRDLLEAARGGVAGALVVEGEAGIGKTTLLAAAEELAGGVVCLWARGGGSGAPPGPRAPLALPGSGGG